MKGQGSLELALEKKERKKIEILDNWHEIKFEFKQNAWWKEQETNL